MLSFLRILIFSTVAGAIAYGVYPHASGVISPAAEQHKTNAATYAKYPGIQRFLSSPTGNSLLRESNAADAAILRAEKEIAASSSLPSDESHRIRAIEKYLDAGIKQLEITQKIGNDYIKWAEKNEAYLDAETRTSLSEINIQFAFAIIVAFLTAAILLLIRVFPKHGNVSAAPVVPAAPLHVPPRSNREIVRHYISLFQKTISRCRPPNEAQKKFLLEKFSGIGELALLTNDTETPDIPLGKIHAILNRFLKESAQANARPLKDEWDPSAWEILKNADPDSPLFR